jgi:hypothetical protein
VIGVDVVNFVVRTQAEAWSHGQEAFAPEGLDELGILSREIADKAEPAFDFVVDHGLRGEALGVRGGNANGGLTFRRNGRGQLLIQKASEDHNSHIAGFAIGDT